MEFVKIHQKKNLINHKNGKWEWDEAENQFKFISESEDDQKTSLEPSKTSDLEFKSTLDYEDELIFRRVFARQNSSYGSQYITIQDIKNLAFYLAPSKILEKNFIEFFYTEIVDKFLNVIIIYFEYFLKVIEFLCKRRKEMQILGKIRTLESVKVEEMISDYLGQYRLLVAREYAQIILGVDQKKNKFRYDSPSSILTSLRGQHKITQDYFVGFVTHIVWIAMHRKHYQVIEAEMNRLFSTKPSFRLLHDSSKIENVTFTKVEKQILYGRNFKNQSSPLIQEILNISEQNIPLLSIGIYKYFGTDPRIFQIELETVIHESQLHLIGASHGILGHPKSHYDTMLTIVWDVVKKQNYDKNYDPFRLIRKPILEIPKWEDYKKKHKTFEPYFELHDCSFEKDLAERQIKLWKRRDLIIKKEKENGVDDDLTFKIKKFLKLSEQEIQIDRGKIMENFRKKKLKTRKNDNLPRCSLTDAFVTKN